MVDRAPTALFEALSAGGAVGRFVGGCVRNAVLGVPVSDLDVATDATPERVMELAAAAGLKAVGTGILHGTVTVVVDHEPIEVTTLRRDVRTDGRRAEVAFTDDWEADARRRDFALNALYMDPSGSLYDPTGTGYDDAKAGRIRFVGDPETRIREDVLRILRFFRFNAAYGRGDPDPAGLAACARLADQLSTLSGERIAAELMKLLAAPRAGDILVTLAEAGIARHLWDGPAAVDTAVALIALEDRLALAPDPERRLAALIDQRSAVDAVADRLRLSKHLRLRLSAALSVRGAAFAEPKAGKAAIYRDGALAVTDARLLHAARTGEPPATLGADLELTRRWEPPVFPLRGGDVEALGVPPGPRTGELLRAVEDWWIAGGFVGDARACRVRLQELVQTKER